MTILGLTLSSTDLMLLAVNALVATSLYTTMVVGVFSLGQVAFMAIGAYGFAYTTTALHWAPWLGTVTGTLVATLIALIFSLPILRVAGIYLAILTIALIYMVQFAAGAIPALGGVSGLYGPLQFSALPPWIVLVITLSLLVLVMRLPIGKALRGIGADETLARSVGVYAPGVKVVAFTVGGLIAGLAGALYSYGVGYTSPALFGVDRAIQIVLFAVVGGLGAPVNPALGAILLTLLGIVLRPLNQWGLILSGVIILLVIIARPGGVFPGSAQLIRTAIEPLRRRRVPGEAA
jgi:branched-chain amino acid transport system permease protein